MAPAPRSAAGPAALRPVRMPRLARLGRPRARGFAASSAYMLASAHNQDMFASAREQKTLKNKPNPRVLGFHSRPVSVLMDTSGEHRARPKNGPPPTGIGAGPGPELIKELRAMSMLLDPPPVRTGRCGLTLSIDGRRYRLRPAPPTGRGSKIWRLTVLGGQSRAGADLFRLPVQTQRRLYMS